MTFASIDNYLFICHAKLIEGVRLFTRIEPYAIRQPNRPLMTTAYEGQPSLSLKRDTLAADNSLAAETFRSVLLFLTYLSGIKRFRLIFGN